MPDSSNGWSWKAAACGIAFAAAGVTQSYAASVPHLDHIIVIVMENKNYDQARAGVYTQSLMANGAYLTDSHGVTHPSQPNYLALWSGGLQNVSNDNCPAPGSPFTTENLGHACEAAGLTWKAYSEQLPFAGFSGCGFNFNLYARKHAPWTNWSNLDHNNERPYGELAVAESLGTLPNLAFVVPDQCNDTHNSGCPVSLGDTWLSKNVPGMLKAVGPRGAVILTWDEDDFQLVNRILTVFCSSQVYKNFAAPEHVDHYNVLRTICDALGIAPMGAAANATPITSIWDPTVAVEHQSWSAVKSLYRR